MNQSRCKECGRTIYWIECDGKKIALDPKPWTYHFDGTKYVKSSAQVTHWATCPVKIINKQNEENKNATGKSSDKAEENSEELRTTGQWWLDRD